MTLFVEVIHWLMPTNDERYWLGMLSRVLVFIGLLGAAFMLRTYMQLRRSDKAP
jgi:hypothetical protein